jgi:enoyl-CoA hydratase
MAIVEVEVDDGVATITLNRPERRNALSGEVTDLLDDIIVDLDGRDDVSVMILTGADPAFCAGFDLKMLATEPRSAQQERVGQPVPHVGLMPEHVTPIIGAINGATVTGGLELALGCDFLIASERARFADTHARVGMMPGGGLTVRLPQLIGIDRARRMSFTGDFIDAATACAWGLVVEVVPHEALLSRARQLAAAVVSIPAANVQEVRRMYDEMGALLGPEAWTTESTLARRWVAERFDQARLVDERENIIARGRAQSTAGDRPSA